MYQHPILLHKIHCPLKYFSPLFRLKDKIAVFFFSSSVSLPHRRWLFVGGRGHENDERCHGLKWFVRMHCLRSVQVWRVCGHRQSVKVENSLTWLGKLRTKHTNFIYASVVHIILWFCKHLTLRYLHTAKNDQIISSHSVKTPVCVKTVRTRPWQINVLLLLSVNQGR